jgi:tetratricopeptide (TPR) repeat protein
LTRLELAERKIDAFNLRLDALDEYFPGNKDVILLRARQASLNNDFSGAVEALSDLVKDTPHPDVIINLAKNQWYSGDRQAAISGLELWTADNKDDLQSQLVLANFYAAENRMDESVKLYLALDKQIPKNPIILNNLAWSLADSNPRKGLEYAERARNLQRDNPLILDTLAMLMLKTGDEKGALKMALKAVEIAPEVDDIQINLVEIYKANGMSSEAREVLQILLDKTTNADQKEFIRQKLIEL